MLTRTAVSAPPSLLFPSLIYFFSTDLASDKSEPQSLGADPARSSAVAALALSLGFLSQV